MILCPYDFPLSIFPMYNLRPVNLQDRQLHLLYLPVDKSENE